MKQEELTKLLSKQIEEYLKEDSEQRAFFGGICDGTKTQLIYGSRSLAQVLGAMAGLIKQMSSACDVPKEEILQTLQLLLTDRQYH